MIHPTRYFLFFVGLIAFLWGFSGFVTYEAQAYKCSPCTSEDLKAMSLELLKYGLLPLGVMAIGTCLMCFGILGPEKKEAAPCE